jgi:hypothetical protein
MGLAPFVQVPVRLCPLPSRLPSPFSQAKRIVGDVHEFKQDVVGRGAKVARYDVYIEKSTGNLYLMDKSAKNPIPTYENKYGTWHPGAGGNGSAC